MVDQYIVEEFIFTNLDKVKRKSGMGYQARCPICGDSDKNPNKRRLHISYYPPYDEWIYTCYNGGCPEPNGNIQKLYSIVKGISYKDADKKLGNREYDKEKVKRRLKGNKFEEEKDEEVPNGILDLDLSDCYTENNTPSDRQGNRYIDKLKDFKKNRYIEHVPCMIAHSGKYKGRFIIPVYIDNKLVYFQGRSMDDDTEPKYLNPEVKKEEIILNSDKFDKNKYIIVTEGLIDAYMIEENQGTSCIGASISDDFLCKVSKMSNKGVIIALDNPEIDKSGIENYIKIIENSKYRKLLRYFFMPFNDIKDLNQLKIEKDIHDVYEFVIKNSCSYFKSSIIISQMS